MKKLILGLLLIFGIGATASAKDNYSRDASTLPAAAQTTLKKNFKADVSVVKIDKDFGRISEYEVVLTDGTEVSFDAKGNWKEVETSASKAVPDYFVLKPIRDYVKKNHAGTRIVGIEKERGGYEVTLSGGIDIKFNREGAFLKYD